MTDQSDNPEASAESDGSEDLKPSPPYVRIAAALPSILWFGWFVLDVHMVRSRPQSPDVKGQFVIPQTEHGGTIYLSKIDSILLNGLFWGAVASLAGLGLLNRLARRPSLPPDMRWVQNFDARTFKQSNQQGCLAIVAVTVLVAYLLYH